MTGLELLIPALLAAFGSAAGGIASSEASAQTNRQNAAIAEQNRISQERMAGQQAFEQKRQREQTMAQNALAAKQQSLMQGADQALQAGQGQSRALSGASNTIRNAIQGGR
jgi:hypothetical protein